LAFEGLSICLKLLSVIKSDDFGKLIFQYELSYKTCPIDFMASVRCTVTASVKCYVTDSCVLTAPNAAIEWSELLPRVPFSVGFTDGPDRVLS
jgi:hypothetical protein